MADFNPIKEVTDGVQAKRVIWTTKTLELALKGLEQGKKLVANPFYENNTKLLKGDLVFQRTKKEIEEWKRCAGDIQYFAEQYCKLMTPEGIQNIELRDYQKKYLNHLIDNRLSIYLSCRQSGKCLTFLTNVSVKIDWSKQPKNYKDKFQRYYVQSEDCYDIPLFELYNMYTTDKLWKIEYLLYKILYKFIKNL